MCEKPEENTDSTAPVSGQKRLPSGRFGKGNQFGRGNGRPKGSKKQYAQMFLKACSAADMKEIIEAAVTKAKAGDKHAREWLAKYLLDAKEVFADPDPGDDLSDLISRLAKGSDE